MTNQAPRRVSRRGRVTIPADLELGRQVSHDTLESERRIREFDKADETRAERALQLLGDEEYDGVELTGWMLRALQPLLDEPINPRHVVTTRGHEMAVTGIKSLQVQVDRLREVLGSTHYRLLPSHTPDGLRCRMHVVIGNNLQWCRVDERGELAPFTIVGSLAWESTILAHADGWGGHTGGFMPGDSRKGAETNAGKRVIARLGPGREIYRLDFEDDPGTVPISTIEPAPEVARSDAGDRAELTALYLAARTQGITDEKVKAMLVASGVIDVSDVLSAIAGLTVEPATLFEASLRDALATTEPAS